MKKKQLLSLLQQVDGFENPKINLEQYITSPQIAADLLFIASETFGDVTGRLVADLGCGSGMLTAGLTALGAEHVIGFDIDPDALALCANNVEELFEPDSYSLDLVRCDVRDLIEGDKSEGRWMKSVDVAVLNPPFGTKNNAGMDMEFLRVALAMATDAVYSLHKTSTRKHVLKKTADWGATAEVLGEFTYDLPATYSFHKKKSLDIAVDLIRVKPKS